MNLRNTHVLSPFVSVAFTFHLSAFPARSLTAFQPALRILLDEPHLVLLVDGKAKPPRIRFTTQLVILGYGNNDANQFFLSILPTYLSVVSIVVILTRVSVMDAIV